MSTVTQPWNFHRAYSPTTTSLPIVAASIAQVNDTAVIAVVRQDGSLWFYWWRSDINNPVIFKEELVAPAGSVWFRACANFRRLRLDQTGRYSELALTIRRRARCL